MSSLLPSCSKFLWTTIILTSTHPRTHTHTHTSSVKEDIYGHLSIWHSSAIRTMGIPLTLFGGFYITLPHAFLSPLFFIKGSCFQNVQLGLSVFKVNFLSFRKKYPGAFIIVSEASHALHYHFTWCTWEQMFYESNESWVMSQWVDESDLKK